MAFLPSTAAVEAATPPGRDRALDLVRLASLLVVVTGHGVMLLVTLTPDHIVFGNLLSRVTGLQAITWLLQVLPLFFFAGAAASVRGWSPEKNWGTWIFGRAQRLYRPVFYYVAAWAVLLAIVREHAAGQVAERIAAISTQLLWFIGVYVMALAAVPLLARIRTGRGLATVVIGLYAGTALVDIVRLQGGPEWIGYLNLWVWLVPAALGIGYTRRLIKPWTAAVAAATMFFADALLVYAGPYELSLVTVDGQRLSNMTPPSLLLAGHAIVLSCVFVVLAPRLHALARKPAVWRYVVVGNQRAMTLYLWHMPALLGVVYVSHLLGFDRSDPAASGFVPLLLVQVAALYALTAVLVVTLGALESRPLPWWDRPVTGRHSTLMGVAVVAAGAVTLLSAKWGLAGTGIECLAWAACGLAAARILGSWPVTPRRRRYASSGSNLVMS